jgi:hypothetical protein
MRLGLIIISLFATLLSWGQFDLSTSLDTTHLRIGEQTTYRITASGIDDIQKLKWPEIKDTLHKHIEVIERLPLDTLSTEPLSLQQAIIITSWDSGYYAIRPLPLTYDGKDYETEALLLSVNTVEVDTTQVPRDIKPIYEEPFSFKDWISQNWPKIFVVLGILLVIWYVIRSVRKAEESAPVQFPAAAIPAHEKALGRLKALHERQAYQEVKKKGYYSELTDTLRAYLEERYRVKALEQTSAEIIEGIRYVGLAQEEVDYLRSLLYTADMVKFAKEVPSDVVAENHLQRAFAFIENTRTSDSETQSTEIQGHE